MADYSVGFRVNRKLWQLIEDAAARDDRTVSSWIRHLILQSVRADRPRRSRPARKPSPQQETAPP
jgi:hypothetical protein